MRKDLSGKIYGNLTVIEKSESIWGGKTKRRKWGVWRCLCKCGEIIIVKTVDLNRESVKSCGCLIKEFGISLKPGEIFGRLTTISYKKGKWICLCECGITVEVKTGSLKNGNTKSCGCLNTERRRSRVNKLVEGKREFDPDISSGRRIWKTYYYRDKNKNDFIKFEEFLEISQLPCYYCGIEPNNKFNIFLNGKGSEESKEKGDFIYNGMDRIDSDLGHRKNNVVPCCLLCNRAKNNLSLSVFMNRINKFSIKKFSPIKIEQIFLPENNYLRTSIKCVYYNYRDGDLKIEEFYYLSQLGCFYCGEESSCNFNYAKKDKRSSGKAIKEANLYYNGLDRIDSEKGHSKKNVVPCCKYCNFAKNKLSLEEYQGWMERIMSFNKRKRAGD